VKRVAALLGIPYNRRYDSSVHYNRPVHHNDLIGIEIEVEGANRIDYHNDGKLWDYWAEHDDGSLRGAAREFVLRRPIGGADLAAAMEAMRGRLDKCNFSLRTSVHVHVDVRDITSQALYRFMLLYILLEELLFDLCGKHRASNNFCIASYHAEGFLATLARISPTTTIRSLTAMNTQDMRYSAMNLDAVRKFGSLEFRGHEGTGDVDRIMQWVNVLTHLKHYAVRTKRLEDLITKASMDGPTLILGECLPANLVALLSDAGDVQTKLLRGARRVQDVIIARDLEVAGNELLSALGVTAEAVTKKPQHDAALADLLAAHAELLGGPGRGIAAAPRPRLIPRPEVAAPNPHWVVALNGDQL
jgi:hypothetical protein